MSSNLTMVCTRLLPHCHTGENNFNMMKENFANYKVYELKPKNINLWKSTFAQITFLGMRNLLGYK